MKKLLSSMDWKLIGKIAICLLILIVLTLIVKLAIKALVPIVAVVGLYLIVTKLKPTKK